MKRTGNLFDSIADWANLRLAAAKALRGKRAKADARSYVADLDANLHRLREQLLDIDGYSVAPGKGLPIGSLTSQHFANFYLGWFDRFAKERLRVPGYVRYMDDMALWSESALALKTALSAARQFLADELQLKLKPEPYLNRTARGMDLLGCRVFPTYQVLNARSRRRFRRKLRTMEHSHAQGDWTELEYQQRSQALVAFTRTPGLKSWRFRNRVIQDVLGYGQGLGSRAPRR